MKKVLNLLLDLFFPKFCLGCKKEGTFLCEDCFSIIEFAKEPLFFKNEDLERLYFVGEYKNPVLKKFIRSFKYPPFLTDLKEELTKIFTTYFSFLSLPVSFSEFYLLPVPLEKKKEKWRGFNQSEEIAKILSSLLSLPLSKGIIKKIKITLPQVTLSEKERKDNVKGAFSAEDKEKIKGKKFLIVDDVFTTGATMKEIAKILKQNGAEKIWGIVLAKGTIEDDLR